MALGDFAGDLTEVFSSFPVDVSERILDLILVLKAIGVVAVIYVVYMIIVGALTYRKMKRLGNIEERINSIDKKINKLLKLKKK